MKVSDKGQVTIPIRIRRMAGFLPNTEVAFVMSGKNVILKKSGKGMGRGERIVAALRGRATKRFTTDEIMALTRGE
jgi:bifunctional DNA-binding transcriptional regulator/antitoxin component of YhaV-PrlF toxin-antitoxin module